MYRVDKITAKGIEKSYFTKWYFIAWFVAWSWDDDFFTGYVEIKNV